MEDWPGLVDRSDNIIKMRSPRTSPLTKIVSTILSRPDIEWWLCCCSTLQRIRNLSVTGCIDRWMAGWMAGVVVAFFSYGRNEHNRAFTGSNSIQLNEKHDQHIDCTGRRRKLFLRAGIECIILHLYSLASYIATHLLGHCKKRERTQLNPRIQNNRVGFPKLESQNSTPDLFNKSLAIHMRTFLIRPA